MNHSESDTYKKNQSTHSLNISIATQLKSADQALFLHHINYWIEYNERLKRNFYDGKYWTYNTLEDLHGHFPYWTKDQLRNIIDKLVDKGILLKGNYNENKYDRTVWYSIDWKKLESPKSIWENSQMDMADFPNQDGEKPKSNTHNKPYNKTSIYSVREPPVNNNLNSEDRKSHGKFVKLSSEEYELLCKKESREKVDAIIEEINDYCTNNRQEGYPDYAAIFRTFLRNQNKQGKNYAARDKGRTNKRQSENPTGIFVNGIRVG